MIAPFPWWVDVLLAIVAAWPLTLLVVLILGFTGKFTSWRWRVLVWGLGGGLALILLVVGGAMLSNPIEEEWTKLRLKAISGVTKEPRLVNGFVLPAGSKVQWSAIDKDDFYSADVPVKMAMLGVVVKGKINHDARAQEKYYDLSLAEPRQFDEWSCGVGDARMHEEGQMLACTLAVATAWQGLHLPADTYMDRTFATMRFVMPDDRGMAIADGKLSVPPTGVLEAGPSGTLLGLQATWKDTPREHDPAAALMERGVKLDTSATFYPQVNPYEDTRRLPAEYIVSKLFAAAPCKDVTLPAGTSVDIPVEGDLTVTDEPAHLVAGCLR